MDCYYCRNKDLLLRSIAGEHMLVSCGTDAAFDNKLLMLTDSGAFIWNCLERPCTEPEISDLCKKEFEGDSNLIDHEVHNFLIKMCEYGLIFKIKEEN